jgi:hypothetical protein
MDSSMTKINPTVGRVVWFMPSRLTGDYGFTHIDGRKPLAALITHVFHDALVNLSVFDQPNQRPACAARRGQARTRLFLRVDAVPGRAGGEGRASPI